MQIRELMNDYSPLGKQSFLETARVLNDLRMEILDQTPVFEIPLSRGCISYCLGLSQFKELTR